MQSPKKRGDLQTSVQPCCTQRYAYHEIRVETRLSHKILFCQNKENLQLLAIALAVNDIFICQ